MKTQKNIMLKPQKTMSNIEIFTLERWINPESCTPEREITQADLKKKQWRGNTLYLENDRSTCIHTIIFAVLILDISFYAGKVKKKPKHKIAEFIVCIVAHVVSGLGFRYNIK